MTVIQYNDYINNENNATPGYNETTKQKQVYLMFLEQVADTDDVFTVILGAQLCFHLIHPRFQLIRLAVERHRLVPQQNTTTFNILLVFAQ